MEDTSSTKEVSLQGASVYYPWSFHGVIRAILKCLGLETEIQQSPSNPKKEDDGKVDNNQPGRQEEGADAPPTKYYSDPPSTVTDSAADDDDDPPSTTGDHDPGLIVSLSAPKRPGTSSGRGPQIN